MRFFSSWLAMLAGMPAIAEAFTDADSKIGAELDHMRGNVGQGFDDQGARIMVLEGRVSSLESSLGVTTPTTPAAGAAPTLAPCPVGKEWAIVPIDAPAIGGEVDEARTPRLAPLPTLEDPARFAYALVPEGWTARQQANQAAATPVS